MNNHARSLTWVLVLLLGLALVLVVSVSAIVGADNTRIICKSQSDNAETLRLIRSCTTPGMKCFDDGQKRTAEVVADINRVAVYAAACADMPGVQGSDEIYACVVRQLAEADEQETP